MLNGHSDTSQVLKEMKYLSHLINEKKQHLLKSRNQLRTETTHFSNNCSIAGQHFTAHISNASNVQSTKHHVYVNPNYRKKQSIIHINPQKCRSGIYVNPKLVELKSNQSQNFAVEKSELQKNAIPQIEKPKATISEKLPENTKLNSVYVKPELMQQLITEISNTEKTIKNTKTTATVSCANTQNYKILSKTKLVKNSTPIKKPGTSNFLSISKRKLIKCSPKSLNSAMKFRKRMSPDKRKLIVNNVHSLKKLNNIVNHVNYSPKMQMKASPINKYKIDRTNVTKGIKKTSHSTITKYKVDRTTGPKGVKRNRVSMIGSYKVDRTVVSSRIKRTKPNVTKYKVDRTSRSMKRKSEVLRLRKMRGRQSKVIEIEGCSYQISRNNLVKNCPTVNAVKRRKSLPISQREQFLITKNGKKLHRVVVQTQSFSVKKNNGTENSLKNTSIKNVKTVAVPKRNQMHYLSTNARQRSLQLMQSKLRKNNQPCLVFRRYGFCPKQERGICFKVHNKKQVALCQKFLQGKCLSDDCKLSHDVGPEKMPTCKYFLDGCCNRDSCPYRHVKVSDNTPICVPFLEGYCEKGNECKHRHIFLCPEFEKTGSCSKGKNCSYPHKSESNKKQIALKRNPKESPKTQTMTESNTDETEKVIEDTCKRYYNDASSVDLMQKRRKLLKQVQLIKETQTANCESMQTDDYDSDIYIDSDDDIIVECVRVKKPPVGALPSFIPID